MRVPSGAEGNHRLQNNERKNMANLLVDTRDQKFILNEQFSSDRELSQTQRYSEYDEDTLNSMLNAANDLAVKEIFPTLTVGDKEGVKFKDGEVAIPESFHKIYAIFCENGWLNAPGSPDYGGMGLPYCYWMACNESFMAANSSFTLYHVLTHGVGRLIEGYGSDNQREKYLSKVYSGIWSGTMCLTESGAGSDLANLKTKAIPVDLKNGLYKIVGEKIFISGGEHNFTSNIIHMVLARTEGDDEGYQGISLFIVPKFRVTDQGEIKERNGVFASNVEHKMGLNGSATCTLVFGQETDAIGELVGRVGKGLSPIMFSMMNEERIQIGIQALGIASCAFMHAVKFAKERLQGIHVDPARRDAEVTQIPIINHPDVRRMIFTMKAYVEGMRALIYWAGLCVDRSLTRENGGKWKSLSEFLTPLVKAYTSDRGHEINIMAIQVHGGYGYTKEFPVEQLARDNKITSIYEGTNGIQAIDFLVRKLSRNNGEIFNFLVQEIRKTLKRDIYQKELRHYKKQIFELIDEIKKLITFILPALGKNISLAYGSAVPLLEIFGDMVLGWMWIWQMGIALEKTAQLPDEDNFFYKGKITTAKFFLDSILPQTMGKIKGLLDSKEEIFHVDENSIVSNFEYL